MTIVAASSVLSPLGFALLRRLSDGQLHSGEALAAAYSSSDTPSSLKARTNRSFSGLRIPARNWCNWLASRKVGALARPMEVSATRSCTNT